MNKIYNIGASSQVCYLKTPVLTVISTLLLTVLGGTTQAGEIIIYDNDPSKLSPDIWGNSSLFSSKSLTGNTIKVVSGAISGSVFGGITDDDQEVSGNSVTVSGGQINESVYGGYSSDSGNVMNNHVTISGGNVIGNVFGGDSDYGNVTNNSVTISGGEVDKDVFGGYSREGNVANNSVIISGGEVHGDVYGGNSALGSVTGNTISISAGNVANNSPTGYYGGVIGGYSYYGNATSNRVTLLDGQVGGITGGHSNDGNATNNSVIVLGGKVRGVIGGSSYSGSATGNSVTISGGEVGDNVYGGFSHSGNVMNNHVTISGVQVVGRIYGGESDFGSAAGNSVTISGGEVDGLFVIGGHSNFNNATNNRVIISGGEVNGNGGVYGGFSFSGSATGNSVTISGGKVAHEVIGGYSGLDNTNATNNSVTISGGEVSGNVYGGSSGYGSATGNNVSISGTPLFSTNSSIYGGYSSSSSGGDVFTGNTLNFSAHPVKINEVANFQYYNFTLTPSMANTGDALIDAQSIRFGNGNGTASTIKVVGIHSGKVLNAGDEFILMQAVDMTGNGDGGTSTGVAQQGISLLYDVQTVVDVDGKIVKATILGNNGLHRKGDGDDNGHVARVNPQLKALSEGYLAGAQLVMRGADLLADNTFNAINEQNNKNGWVPFVMMSGQHNRYNSGSHIKSDDFLLTGGLSYQQNNLTAGMLVEGGWGSYDSYNSFYNAADVKGDGNERYYGLGLLGRYDFTNSLYADVSLRFGRNRNKFDTHDIQNIATGHFANYTVTSNYVSAHMGMGYLLPLNDKNQLDLSAKYLWTQLDGKDVNVAGDNIHFDSIHSHRARINATLNHQYSQILALNAGLGYEYEFDGKARATTYDIYSIDAPSMKGGTGIFSLGANVQPGTNQNLKLDFKLDSYTGKREGVGANIRANYTF